MTSPSKTADHATAPSRWHRLLPPQLVLLLTTAMIASLWIPTPSLMTWPWNLLGVPVLAVGVVANLTSAIRFDREQANIVTFEDPTLLLTDGWFARTRNPMYLGFALILVGVALLVGTPIAWLGPAAFLAASNWWYIPFEERRLRALLGREFDDYCADVRRWL